MWFDTWFTNPNGPRKSWLRKVPPTLQWSVSVIGVVWMTVVSIPLTCRASVLGGLSVWIPAFSTHAGVLDVVTSPPSLARCAGDLFIGNGGIVTWTLWTPVLALHEADDAPSHSASECPWPDSSAISLTAVKFAMIAVTCCGEAPTFETSKIVEQVGV